MKENLKADEWRRAATRVKLFPRGIDGDKKESVYRIGEVYGEIVSRELPPAEKYEPIFSALNKKIKNHTRSDDQTPRIVVVNDDNRIFRYLMTSGDIIKRVVRPDRDWLIFVTTGPFEGPSGESLVARARGKMFHVKHF